MRHALRQAASVHHDERRAVRLDQLDQPLVDLLPYLAGHDRLERRSRHLDGQVDAALVASVDNRARRAILQESCHFFDRLLGRRQADALQRPAADVVEPLEREREVGAAARLHHGVDFIDDDDPGGPQHGARALGGQQQVERLRRGHQDMRRRAQHRCALVLGRIAAAHRGGDFHVRGERPDLAPRLGEVLMNVGRKRLQRRHIDDAHFIRQAALLLRFAQQVVDRSEEGGERLAGARGRGDERMLAAPDGAPALELGVGGLGEAARPPALDDGVKILG